jgi:hypothetical protein
MESDEHEIALVKKTNAKLPIRKVLLIQKKGNDGRMRRSQKEENKLKGK